MEWTISQIRRFERQITNDGTVLHKFFLHIDKDEQRRRLLAREQDSLTSWMISPGDWDFHRHYDLYLPLIDTFINGTDRERAPWTVLPATDPQYAILTVYKSIIRRLSRILEGRAKGSADRPDDARRPDWPRQERKKHEGKSRLPAYDLSLSITREEYDEVIPPLQRRVRDLQYMLYKRRAPLIILFEGWDAAGKGGNILRLTHLMNPRGFEVVPIAQPTETELTHHYLWRFFQKLPKSGTITVFDRSWYGRVLVERVEGFCSEVEWQRAYQEINEFEEMLAGDGVGLVKFWLEIDREEQLKRFHQREEDPFKRWKINEEDWRNRQHWDLYRGAVDDMLTLTNTDIAPWTVVESNDKRYARVKTLRTVISAMEKVL